MIHTKKNILSHATTRTMKRNLQKRDIKHRETEEGKESFFHGTNSWFGPPKNIYINLKRKNKFHPIENDACNFK